METQIYKTILSKQINSEGIGNPITNDISTENSSDTKTNINSNRMNRIEMNP